jgi:folate-binding protein YgfZ
MLRWARLYDRHLVLVEGKDSISFLQGLVTQDIRLLETGSPALYSAFLNPAGRLVGDSFLLRQGERVLLDVEASWAEGCVAHLRRYRLRQDVSITLPGPDLWAVWAAWPANAEDGPVHSGPPECSPLPEGSTMVADPRYSPLGWRLVVPGGWHPGGEACVADAEEWQVFRITMGLPERADWDEGRSVPLEAGMADLQGISWTKGCYVGQELTTRTFHRGVVRKRLFPVTVHGAAPAPLDPVVSQGTEVGHVRSVASLPHPSGATQAVALLRLEAVRSFMEHGTPLTVNETSLEPVTPPWMDVRFETLSQ